jgi:ParB-like chromosome segregation protein Spo0J
MNKTDQFKLSKVFHVDPKTLPTPKPVSPRQFPIFNDLRNSMLRNGFDSNHPIIVTNAPRNRQERLNKINDRPSYIMDGNHRLTIALELKLDLVPVRFLHENDIKSIKEARRRKKLDTWH